MEAKKEFLHPCSKRLGKGRWLGTENPGESLPQSTRTICEFTCFIFPDIFSRCAVQTYFTKLLRGPPLQVERSSTALMTSPRAVMLCLRNWPGSREWRATAGLSHLTVRVIFIPTWCDLNQVAGFEQALASTCLARPYLGRSLLGWETRKPSIVDGLETYYAAWEATQRKLSCLLSTRPSCWLLIP